MTQHRRRLVPILLALSLISIATACRPSEQPPKPESESPAMTITITSPAFKDGQAIPSTFTCDGADLSPPLSWKAVPDDTQSLVLIVDDPDAPKGTWVHWVLFDVEATTTDLPEGIPSKATVLSGAKQGKNDFKRIGYGGPCPPPGKAHRYFFKLYALDKMLNLEAGVTKADLEAMMKGHILAQGQLMGLYMRGK